jgi:peptidoglycan/LPS O-acetylase OafA/YrhL
LPILKTIHLKTNFQIPLITGLRGIAALSVVLYHFVCKTIDYIQSENIISIFEYGKRGVDLFFIISGIVIPLSMIGNGYNYKKFGNFITRRIIRIEPPYLVAIVVGIIYLYVRNFIPGSSDLDLTPSFTQVLLHIGYLIPFFEGYDWINQVFWTLSIEFQYYLLLSLLMPLLLTEKYLWRFLFYAVFISMSYLAIERAFLPYWGSLFMVGIVYALFHAKRFEITEFIIVFVLVLTSVHLTLGIFDLVLSVITIGLIMFIPNFKSKLSVFFGNISYSLHVLHSITGPL